MAELALQILIPTTLIIIAIDQLRRLVKEARTLIMPRFVVNKQFAINATSSTEAWRMAERLVDRVKSVELTYDQSRKEEDND